MTDSRPAQSSIYRRLKCLGCKARWTTYEVSAEDREKFVRAQGKVEQVDALLQRLMDTMNEHRQSMKVTPV